jgi:hypothetical protein
MVRMTSLRVASTVFALGLLSCSFPSTTSVENDIPGLSNGDLAQTYTGVLQETGGTQKYYVSLAQQVTVTQSDPAQLTFSSSAFPSFTAIVLSTGQSAVNLDLVGQGAGGSVQVKEVAFTKDSDGNWVLVIQTASAADGAASAVVQFASYDPKNAPPATAVLAVDYLDQMFALAGDATN